MATPARLVKISCPACHEAHWEIDRGFRGEVNVDYPLRLYLCPSCGCHDPGWDVREKSPSSFFLQPDSSCPMRQGEFDHWCEVLRQHFPDHPTIGAIGVKFRPNTQFVRTRLRNLIRSRPHYFGRVRYHIEKMLGWHKV